MPYLLTIASVFVLYSFTVAILVMRGQKRDRFAAIAMGVTLPFVSLIAIVHSLFSRRHDFPPCPAGLEEAEALIERKRQIMFNSSPIQPTIAKQWRRGYAVSVESQARQVREFSLHIKEFLAVA